ncbi:MAG: hypothetical protein JRI68_07105 [Deltaproteobacteria bacterium]|nr:hypothetical protein [Deltaproteobacteria bacterium]
MNDTGAADGGDIRFEDLEPEAFETDEVERRWRAAVRELAAVLERVRDIRLTVPAQATIPVEQERRLAEVLYRALRADDRPELKRSVARRMADKLGQYLLYNRMSSTPALHELAALLPWWISQLPSDSVDRLRDVGLTYLTNGAIIPIQIVWQQLLTARQVYLGHCVCRSAGIADDLHQRGKVFTVLSQANQGRLLDRMMDRHARLSASPGVLDDTADRYRTLLSELAAARAAGSPDYRLDRLVAGTHPDWELLPVHDDYTPGWVRSMHANGKAFPIHPELAFELCTTLFLSRGVIFTAMRMIDTPYSICSCPTPENGGGCVLTNWFYYGMSNASLLPNDLAHGRFRDAAGKVLPCRLFPKRRERECLGCGCVLPDPRPRAVKTVLREADRAYAAYR